MELHTTGQGLFGRIIFSGFGLLFAAAGLFFVSMAIKDIGTTKAMQMWQQTEGRIISSEIQDHGEDFRLDLSYTYTVGGQQFTGTKYDKNGHLTAETIGKINGRKKQFAPGKKVAVFYDPTDPAKSVLRLPSTSGAFAAVGFTLIFPAFGLLFAALPWLRGRKSRAAKKKAPKSMGKRGLILFGAIFAVIGLALLKPLLITPLRLTKAAQSWDAVPATVVSSKVKSHEGDDSTTYSVYIAYRYNIGGRKFFGDRYTFVGGSSSGYESKAEVVRQYPENSSITIYVDPNNPAESVINRDFSTSLYLIGLIPAVFALAGIAVIISGIRYRKPTVDQNQAAMQTVHLKTPSPKTKAFGLGLFTLIWLGVVYALICSDAPLLFPLIFGFFGIILVGASIHAGLAIFNPQPHVEISPGNLQPGSDLFINWVMSGRTDRISELNIQLQCLHITTETYRSGGETKTRTVKTPLHDQKLMSTIRPAEIVQGQLHTGLPESPPPSRAGKQDGIQWQLVFHGTISRWPDMKAELPFIVYP